uniref:Uncharacterized protein n=1 Tax=viral metagenome TaxID=1070528 RepID=A0A6M3JCR5_9ZZZZ
MSTLTEIVTAISDILQDAAYTDEKVISRINKSLQKVSAGVRMPNGEISPCLPDLFAYGTVATSISLPYVSLPTNYQRNVFEIYDSSNNRFYPPQGGSFYSFARFMQQVADMGLEETGSIYKVAIKGSNIYYQGIPSVSTTLGLHYYRKPATLALDGDIPEGIPAHLAEQILQAHVLMNVMGEQLEAGVTEPAVGMRYWQGKFYEGMTDLIDFVGADATPQYYGSDGAEDGGICD